MATIPLPLLGRHCTLTLTPQAVSAAGVLSNSAATGQTAATLTTAVEDVTPRYELTHEEISAMTARRRNNVIVDEGMTLEFTVILANLSLANGGNLVADRFFDGSDSDYFLATLVRGQQTYTFYGIVLSYTETIRKGKSVAVFSLAEVDIGSANPTYS